MLTKEQYLKYSRQLILPEIQWEGQQKLFQAKVLLVGLGGLGSPQALYLAAAGVGTIGLLDGDAVDLSNLQRQVIHRLRDVGSFKVDSAAVRIHELNPDVNVRKHSLWLSSENALDILSQYDIVVDGTDNFPVRYLLNDACVMLGKPLVHGAISRFDGEATVFYPAQGGCCYRCLFPEPPPPEMVPSCAEAGVLGIVPGVVGLIQATEVIKLILGKGDLLLDRMLVFDAMKMDFQEIAVSRDPGCRICGEHPEITTLIDYELFCGEHPHGNAEKAVPDASAQGLRVKELARRLQDGEKVVLLDVREHWEQAFYDLPEGIKIPVSRLGAEWETLLPHRDEQIVVCCLFGWRSVEAVRQLKEKGFSKIWNLEGGLSEWLYYEDQQRVDQPAAEKQSPVALVKKAAAEPASSGPQRPRIVPRPEREAQIYLDYAATSPVRPEVLDAMLPYFSERAGNASSHHRAGRAAKRALEDSRDIVASCLGADPREIYFTSGATESNNLAIQGIAYDRQPWGKHLITSAIEHPSILNCCRYLEKDGFEVTCVPVDSSGLVDVRALEAAIRPGTILISVMMGNNEVGTIQPLAEISALAKAAGIPFHTDAVQAVGKVPVLVDELGVDLLSLSGHKVSGPKGIGALYIRKGTRVRPLLYGGHQEYDLRSGTENIPGIVGVAQALALAQAEMTVSTRRLSALRDRLEQGTLRAIPNAQVNGHPVHRLPHILNLSFEGTEGESLLLALDAAGIAVSTGSACGSESLEPSHVLKAMGASPAVAYGSIRFSIGRETTEADIDRTIETLADTVSRLRSRSGRYAPPAAEYAAQ